MPATWQELYRSDAQGLYALVAVPTLFLVWLVFGPAPRAAGVEPSAARFVRTYAVVFTLETILDPVATGPALGWLGLAGTPVADVAMVPFVLLGDFRVFLLVLVVAAPDRPRLAAVAEAAAWTLLVPAVAWTATAGLPVVLGEVPSMTIWLVYEVAFLVVALGWRRRLVPRRVAAHRTRVRGYLRALLGYVAAYYGLWAAADALIVLAGLDAGWALRMVPNQLYYGFWLPFAYARFFAAS